MCADEVLVINDDKGTVQVDFPSIDAPPITIKIEPEDIPVESEPESENLGKGRCKNRECSSFLPRTKEQHHKASDFCRQRVIQGETLFK